MRQFGLILTIIIVLQINIELIKSDRNKKWIINDKDYNLLNFNENDLDIKHDYAIWSSIARSISEWKRAKLNKIRKKRGILKRFTRRRGRSRRDEEMVCYQHFGCFRDEGPFDYLDTLPASPESISTKFTLHTRETPENGEMLDYLNPDNLRKSSLKPGHPVKIIIHGFGSSGKRPWIIQMTDAFLTLNDVNVITVDWGKGASLPNYVQAAANTRLVGKQIAYLINQINKHNGFKPNDYHLVGFSLGAHIAGYTGTEINNISRITGLDPAAPLFESYSEKVRLDKNDADFVDVIHSNGDSFIRGGLGSFTPMGDIDFYPNGGREQVGCNSVLMGALTDLFSGNWQSLCHHRRAYRFFIDSMVSTCRFDSFYCTSYEDFLLGKCFNCGEKGDHCSNMGYYAFKSKGKGNMYLVTRDKEPFCANQYKISIINRSKQGSTWGKLELIFHSSDMNETFQLTQDSDEIKDPLKIEGIVVAHPNIRNITYITIKYTKYRGWVYNGKDNWSIDKILLIRSDGVMQSYCGINTVLENQKSLSLNLIQGNCTMNTIMPSLITTSATMKTTSNGNKLPRFVWKRVFNSLSPLKQTTHSMQPPPPPPPAALTPMHPSYLSSSSSSSSSSPSTLTNEHIIWAESPLDMKVSQINTLRNETYLPILLR